MSDLKTAIEKIKEWQKEASLAHKKAWLDEEDDKKKHLCHGQSIAYKNVIRFLEGPLFSQRRT